MCLQVLAKQSECMPFLRDKCSQVVRSALLQADTTNPAVLEVRHPHYHHYLPLPHEHYRCWFLLPVRHRSSEAARGFFEFVSYHVRAARDGVGVCSVYFAPAVGRRPRRWGSGCVYSGPTVPSEFCRNGQQTNAHPQVRPANSLPGHHTGDCTLSQHILSVSSLTTASRCRCLVKCC